MKKLNLIHVQETLRQLKKSLFTPQDIKLLFNASNRAITGFLNYNTKKNNFIKLKKRLYSLNNTYISPFLIANRAYQPSYISFETALSYYHLIPETVYSITSATTKTKREWNMQTTSYIYRKIKREIFTGYITKTIEDEQILIALPEKALFDYCYFVYLGKIKEWNNRIDLKNINFKQFTHCLNLFGNEKFNKFVKKYVPQL